MSTLELVKPEEFGLETGKATELMGNLPQIKSERDLLVKQYEEVIQLDIEDPKTSKIAKELRSKIRDNRTKGIQVWHKSTKEVFLRAGQFIDAVKNKEVEVNERMETNLEQIEKHFEILESKRREELKSKRVLELETYSEFVPLGVDLGSISDEEYSKIYNGSKLQYDAKIKAEIEAEAERKRLEALETIFNERKLKLAPYSFFFDGEITIETTQEEFDSILTDVISKKEAFDKEQEQIRLENEKLKAEAEAKAKELEQERLKLQEEANKLKAEADAKLKAEQEAKAKLEAELKAKKDAEDKAEQERIKAEAEAKKEAEKLAKAPIKKQLETWVDTFELPALSTQNDTADEIIAKFEAFKKWAKSEIEKI